MTAVKAPRPALLPSLIICIVVGFAGLLFGYTCGEVSGIVAMDYVRKTFSTGYINPDDGELDITSQQSSQIVSLLSAGTFIGCLFAAPLADRVGRKIATLISTVIFAFGVALQTAATAIPMFTASRFFCGLGLGVISTVVPMYLSESAPSALRGAMVGSYQFINTIGLLLAAVICNATKDRDDSSSYRIPVSMQFIYAFGLAVGMFYLPESPYFRIKQDRYNDAMMSLSKLRRLPPDHPDIVEELSDIKAHLKVEASAGSCTYRELATGNLGYRLLTGCLLQALQQLTGINFIFYFGTSFFSQYGIASAFVIEVIMNVVNVVSTVPGLFIVDRWGRRPILLFGSIGMTISALLVASIGTGTHDSGTVGAKCLIAFCCTFIFFFACAWGVVGWVICSEIFPLRARAKGVSITTATQWIFNWALSYSTPYMVNSGPGNADLKSKVFFIWGGFCAVGILYTYFMVFETRGLTLEQINDLYAEVEHAWQTSKWVPKTISVQEFREDDTTEKDIDVKHEQGPVEA